MRSTLLILALSALPAFGTTHGFQAIGTDAAAWSKILGSVGIPAAKSDQAQVIVVGSSSHLDIAALAQNHFVILEGVSPAARNLGLAVQPDPAQVRQIVDIHAPDMQIFWQQPVAVGKVELPLGFKIFAREKWKGLPVLAGKRTSNGAILWAATSPGDTGIERYPCLLQALVDLGLPLPVKSASLWAFFDSAYRVRADVDYLARRWRSSGISILHVAAWHNMERDPVQDEYLQRLIQACHRNAILVYAWLELPHVSEKFWADHPQWREKTAAGQDAELDWRKLMNLQNPDCKKAVAQQVTGLLERFDWDGVNIAELYFESLEGASVPARFTPMNDDVRREFQNVAGFDPQSLFETKAVPERLRRFLDYRAELASKMQVEWLSVADQVRQDKPYFDVVLTHIDDRFEAGIRDALGADIARSLPLIQSHRSSLLVEDPATIWNLGPERYGKLAQKYAELTKDRSQIGVDINIVERYQDVYPTKKQTGVELFQLVHQAATSFQRVALYFENSLEKQDLDLLPAAATTTHLGQPAADELDVDGPSGAKVEWQGNVELDGKLWPLQNSHAVLVPAGKHKLTTGFTQPPVTITDFNGEIESAQATSAGVDLSYSSRGRSIALVGTPVSNIEVDGAPYLKRDKASEDAPIFLPAGQHLVTFKR